MNCRKGFLSTIAIGLLIAAPLIVTANKDKINDNPTAIVTTGAPPPSISITDLLPEKLAGAVATSEVRQYTPETLATLASDKTAIYQEYNVTLAASRLYGATRVDVLKTEKPNAAFGLFTYTAKENPKKLKTKLIGTDCDFVADGMVFWKQSYFVKVTNVNQGGKAETVHASFASAVDEKIPDGEASAERPILLERLPKNFLIGGSEKYFVGPESLNAYIARARDMFSFDGSAEAVVAEYRKTNEAENPLNNDADKKATKPRLSSKQKASAGAAFSPQAAPLSQPLQLVIVEYHTPQFCTDAMHRLNGFMATLSEDERNRFLVKRVGNFIVGATNFEDREFAEALLNTIEYPYVVQWLQNPAIPTNDPFAIPKVGQMLVSTFNLIGLSGGIMLLSGGILGTTLFFRRRKQQRELFSDAGGMIGLHLDPVDESLLSLPPEKRKQ